ncbi:MULTISPECIES: GMC family oxidoreductase [Rhizobium]|uniref:GMC family oxidoreductase N-terminal domain-containing protein n=1 Tax=Rhizobium brockwellii TaxID=3019932 RepID=A0ABU3YX55_9HYPH|nr:MULTISPECIES: GMC family oxidoreductase N-terminal domain-containing protein [Rhizobium]MDV4159391.1 GMC family oxidoreductase N-terminal domain-containing protein [Rhizobium brockwellii]MDV4183202.1 GMC family oxidoreductase N-terminal domain-containing protein [Rhizobium brockwellii]MDV4190253.1 GMC family oxidoreductase N-terminal domain-containing protein [Rhizobium brockwellii]NZD54447.1 GMC family oxidoreductase N-terminal domain-containing protein [Rhizobium leguminosarum]TAW18123.1 
MIADHLILGGGSAGCVLAARLSEDQNRTVVLVEAGRNIAAGDIPDAVRSRYPGRAYLDTRNIWASLTSLMGYSGSNSAPRTARRYEQAKILGGGSAINALMANRGAPSDYAEWQALGADGWSWEDCLPYFRKIETDRDFSGPLHGTDGPLTIRRITGEKISPFVDRVMQTLEARGHPIRPDQNGPWQDGTFRGAVAVSDAGERLPTSIAYLTPDVRRRPNLRVITDSTATRILFDGVTAIGAEIAGTVSRTIMAQEVIVASGAIHSPALLLRSGIGPGADLAALGIPVISSRSGIGRNLMEHPSIAVAAYLPPSMRVRDRAEHHEQAIWRFSSDLPGTPQGDMHAAILSRSGWHSVGLRMGSLFFWVNKSYSRGFLKLASADPLVEPEVDFRMLSDVRDLERLKMALRMGAQTLRDPHMNSYRGVVFPSSYSPRVAKVAVPGAWNALQRGVLSAMLDLAGPLRAALVHSAVTLGTTLDDLLADDAALTEFVRRDVGGTWHPSGTCRMGAPADPMAVTSPSGRVYGVEGLRVCDASLMPSIPCANTNIPTIMIAERIADFIRNGQ